VSQLKLLCDEVFGEENFVSLLSVENNPKGRKNSDFVSVSSEFLLIFARDKKNAKFMDNIPKKVSDMKLDENGIYVHNSGKRVLVGDNDFNDPVSNIKSNKDYVVYYQKNNDSFIISKDSENYGKELKEKGYVEYKSRNSNGTLIENTYTSSKLQEMYENKLLEFSEDKIYEKNIKDTIRIKSQLVNREYDAIVNGVKQKFSMELTTTGACNQLKSLFDLADIPFSAPKNIGYLKLLISLFVREDFIILDFFSGSATTAHAVMQLNAEDGGNRKFIMVQIPEEIDPKKSKAAYDFCVDELKQEPVITTIGKERIKRAANKIKKENESKLEEKPLDLGFKLFKIKSIPEKYIERMKDENNELLVTKMLSKEELQALLITWKTYDGYPLTKELKTVQFGKYNSYVVDRILYLVNTDFNLENLLEFIKKLDSDGDFVINKIVIFGYHFNSDILLTIKDMVTTYRNKKSIELDVEVRY
jgi:hypothetical protein